MRILIITPTYLPRRGGAELGIYELARRWHQRHQVCVLTPRLRLEKMGSPEMLFSVVEYWDPLYIPKIAEKFHLPWLTRLLPPISLTTVLAGFKAVRSFCPDVVNVHYLLPNALMLPIIRALTHAPIVLSLISRMDVPGLGMSPRWGPFARSVARRADATVFLTPDSHQAFWSKTPVEGLSSHIIPYGVDVGEFSPSVSGKTIRQQLGISSDTTVIFTLQRLVPVKRVDILIQTMVYLRKYTQDAFRLVIGGSGPEADKLAQMVRDLHLEKIVHFTGFIPDDVLPHYFAAADIFAFASPSETFGVVLAQALASGKPVVATRTFAVRDVIEQGKSGLLVEPENPQAIARAILKLMMDRELAGRMGKTGRRKAETTYNWDVIVRQYEAVFSDLLDQAQSI